MHLNVIKHVQNLGAHLQMSHFGNQTFGNLINMTIPISGNDP
jgi:hypothetical protein